MKLLYYMLQIFWVKVGRRIFYGLYHSMLNPYERFSDYDQDVFARAKRDYSFYAPYIDFSGRRILDVGSGLGRKTAFASTIGGHVVGVEICKEGVKEAHLFAKKQGFSIDFIVADAKHLPFKQESFEIVVSNDAMEHFASWSMAILEMKRVVQSGGYMCLNFGPLWLSPFGSHMDFDEHFSPPWGHLFFSENTIKDVLFHFGKIRESEKSESLFMHHLNRVTVREFKQLIKETHLIVIFFKLRTVPPFGLLLKTPFYEYFTTGVVAILQHAPSFDISVINNKITKTR